MILKPTKFDRNLINCIILCFIAASLSLVWAIIEGNGFFTVRDDFDVQQIPFSVLANNMLAEGLDGWCWNLDLGSSMVQGLGFYNLGSPFFWLTLLFPSDIFPYIVGYIYILKYVVAGVSAYIYIKLFVKNPTFAVSGALLYAFSGFQSVNLLFYHLHDVVSFFPLMLYGLEKAMEEKGDKKIFIFAVFINCLTNYYCFVQEVVFLIIYFAFRFIVGSSFREVINRIFICSYCGIFGIAMSAILFLPSVLYISNTSRVESELSLSQFFFNPIYNLFVTKGFLLPGEAMHDNSSVIKADYSSTGSYLPLVGLSLVFAYFYKNKNWLSNIVKTLIIISFFPFVSSCFILFAENNRRWWYMLVLMMALISSIVLQNMEDYKKHIIKGVILNLVCVTLFYLGIRLLPWQYGFPETLTFHNIRLFGLFLITIVGLIGVLVAIGFKKHYYRCILAGI